MSLQRKFPVKRKVNASNAGPSTSKRRASAADVPSVSTDTPEDSLANAVADKMMIESPVLSAPADTALTGSPPTTSTSHEDGPSMSTGSKSDAISTRVWNASLNEGSMQIKGLFTALKNGRASDEEKQRRKESVRAFLFYLEHELGPSPKLKNNQIDAALKFVKDKATPGIYPEDIAAKATQLFDQFTAENWGADTETEAGESDDEPAPNTPSPTTQSNGAGGADGTDRFGTSGILLPPPNHSIWGKGGIMHGLARKTKKGGGFSYVFDERYISEKREFRVIGSNGLTPGDWWPFQRLALFHGAHGSSGGGISGSPEHGCYSIVVSGKSGYHDMDMDEDLGERLLYSADSSIDNKDRDGVGYISNRTRSLQKSLQDDLPVRVLRSAGRNHAYAPIVGIRYDGLYHVVRQREKTNASGGKYLQFELHRLHHLPESGVEQRRFDETVAAAPTGRQQSDYRRIRGGY